MKIGIIGAGRVGLTMLECFRRQGYTIRALYSRNTAELKAVGRQLGVSIVDTAAKAAADSDILLLAVPDRAIVALAEQLAMADIAWQGKFVYHFSGSQSSESLSALAKMGANCGSMHPLQTFPSPEAAVSKIAGTYFAIDGNDNAVALADTLVCAIGGIPMKIPADKRALYHAAACIACNYFAALMQLTKELLDSCGIGEAAIPAMQPLVEATWQNILQQGPLAALTGPIVRGDAVTVQKHCEALKAEDAEKLLVYKSLGEYTLAMARKRPDFSAENADVLAAELQKQTAYRT